MEEMNADKSLEACRQKVGGQTELILKLVTDLAHFILHQDKRHTLGLSNALGVLIEGATGTGKMHVACSLAECMGLGWKIVPLSEIFRSTAADIPNRILDAFCDEQDSIFIVENVELLAGKASRASGDYERSVHAAFSHVFEKLAGSASSKIIIGVTSNIDLLEKGWLCGTRFAKRYRVSVSKPEQRLEILLILLKGMCEGSVINEVAKRTHGYTVADLQSLKAEALISALNAGGASARPGLEEFVQAMKVVRPSLMAEYYQRLPRQSMEELVGLDRQIEHLRELIITPLREPELCKKYRVGLPKGILVYGPPGCGKTHLVNGLVKEAGLNYISVSATSIRSKYVGQSEKNLAALFAKARECAPSLLVIDHLDGLVTRRGDSGGTSDSSGNRLITCFLTEMDGLLQKGEENRVVVIGITNFKDKMDEAMIRPGRLGIHFYISGEVSKEDRAKFFRKTRVTHKFSEAEIEALVDGTEGFNGAKLDWLMREAAMRAIDVGCVRFEHIKF